ncbi:hypothetical protein BAUCODRAFT_389627 [Baudoinia panamericana UAMH 10762]|uniref:Uncharacterized protein n=1 Tax=Baudoinia panamericana (strain UAMH 10762) TaxID=717646 RepID=M2LWM8_BAUPA|nr:uncharacterized protein BAUCODRAFT_389627 [Baudoinia panamericana UAMH 10762]EMC99062.1 hypothetical protein BAUCODRAFT_389627 [Baudoinia panamericana UAMH 10762]
MKQPVTVEYASPGLQPPVYVFTSLSDPQWSEVEMEQEKKDDGEYRFSQTFAAEEGEYQYKFRLGPGDWWALDDTKPSVDDGMGNKNNLLTVKAPAPVQAALAEKGTGPNDRLKAPATVQPEATAPVTLPRNFEQSAPAAPTPAQAPDAQPKADRPTAIQLPTAVAQPETVATPAPAPLMPHEEASASAGEPPKFIRVPDVTVTTSSTLAQQGPVTPAPAPLMKHESFFPQSAGRDQDDQDEWDVDHGDEDLKHAAQSAKVTEHPVKEDRLPGARQAQQEKQEEKEEEEEEEEEEEGDDDDDVHLDSPLLRHESMTPDAIEQTQAPLMRHKSSAIGEHLDEPNHYTRSSEENLVAEEADPNDPSLEKFPTDQAGIYQHIQRSCTELDADEGEKDHARVNSPSSRTQSLPSVQEDDEDDDPDQVREQGGPAATKETAGEQVGPVASEVPVVMVTKPQEPRPRAPMTPPMTPKEIETETERVAEEIVELAIVGKAVEETVAQATGEQTEKDETQEATLPGSTKQADTAKPAPSVLLHPMVL